MRYTIATLGCKVNQYETQAMETLLHRHGHLCAAPGELADAVIVNTCAVTAESGRKSRQTIRRLREENPGAVIAVAGCYSQLSPEDSAALGADVVFGTDGHAAFIEAVEKAVESRESARFHDDPFRRREFEKLPAGALAGRTRAMLKIQDGCVNFCTYCIIPYTRGRLRSLPLADATAEAKRLSEAGCRELVLTGIEIASYGVDLPGKPGLIDLIETVAAASGPMRLRLGSLEPTVVTEDFCRRAAATGKLCRHFHLSLQSGCDRTLRAMNRKYDTARFAAIAALLRQYFPGCALTADVIAGFPGETEEDQRDTLCFLGEIAFAQAHVFPYSRRPGTPADAMPGQLPAAVKAARARELQRAVERTRSAYLESCVGHLLPVLFESPDGAGSVGHSDTYQLVRVAEEGLRGELRNVRITGVEGELLRGQLD